MVRVGSEALSTSGAAIDGITAMRLPVQETATPDAQGSARWAPTAPEHPGAVMRLFTAYSDGTP